MITECNDYKTIIDDIVKHYIYPQLELINKTLIPNKITERRQWVDCLDIIQISLPLDLQSLIIYCIPEYEIFHNAINQPSNIKQLYTDIFKTLNNAYKYIENSSYLSNQILDSLQDIGYKIKYI